MITGVETAGLMLANFHLVIYALEHYHEGFGPLETWWEFKPNFSGFENDIRLQSTFFDENLVELISKIISSDAKDGLATQKTHL